MKIIFEVSTVKDAKDAISMLSSMVERSRLEYISTAESILAPQDDMCVDGLGLLVRTQNCLKAERIYHLSKLLRCTKSDLLKMPNLGRKALNEIIERLDARGLKLKAEA